MKFFLNMAAERVATHVRAVWQVIKPIIIETLVRVVFNMMAGLVGAEPEQA